jgi:hypothetical protein
VILLLFFSLLAIQKLQKQLIFEFHILAKFCQ